MVGFDKTLGVYGAIVCDDGEVGFDPAAFPLAEGELLPHAAAEPYMREYAQRRETHLLHGYDEGGAEMECLKEQATPETQ